MAIEKGFIFVNEEGQYAVPRMSFDHGPTREIIVWVDSIDSAHVFPHPAMVRRKHKSLEKCQSLKAVVQRRVLLQNWES